MNGAIRIPALALVVIAAAATATEAQQTTLSGQVRPRMEIADPGTGTDAFTSMRTRIGLDALIDQNLSIYVEAQDVRIWGEETSTRLDFSADAIDVHQAYLRYNGDELDWLTATIGRQVTWFGGERLVGLVNWSQQGQAFDGVRLDLADERGSVALVGYTIADLSAGPAFEDRQLFGAYATRPDVGPGTLDAYWLFDRARAATETDQHSIGARWAVEGEIDGRLEATYQLGTRADTDVAAFMFGARVGTAFAEGRARATLWYDYVSGDDPATPEVEVFGTLYATGHKFYGLADVFTNIPAHTGGAGLQDIAAKLSFTLRDDLTGNVDVHTFRAADDTGLSSAHFGDELDLSLLHRYSPNFSVMVGFSYFVQDEPLAEVGRLGDDFKWFYVMFDASF
jgi:hypothetical protein